MTMMVSPTLIGAGGGASPIAVAAYPTSVFSGRAIEAVVSIQTEIVTATPTGGTGPYTYAWSVVSSSGGPWTINSPAAAETKFTCAGVDVGDTFLATFKCTVTDAFSVSGESDDVSATVTNYGSGGFA